MLVMHGVRKSIKNDFGVKLKKNDFTHENPTRDAYYEIFETLSCLDDLSKCASMHAVTRFIAIVRFPMLFESSHCSKLKFSKTINHF